MGAKSSRRTKHRRPLNRQKIVNAAVAFADSHGIETLSMRVLSRDLGFGVMSLYNHVANKDDLLDGMVDFVASEIDHPCDGVGWKTAIRDTAVSAHEVFLRHSWVNTLWSNRGPGPGKLNHLESILRVFRESGFSVELACRGFHAVTMHIVGFTLQKLDFPIKDSDIAEAASSFLSQVSTEEFPYFTEHVRHHLTGSNREDDFGFMLDLILDGLERNLVEG